MPDNLDFQTPVSAQRSVAGLRLSALADANAGQAQSWQSDRQFIAMLDAYRPSGGLARAPEVAAMCRSGTGMGPSALADKISNRKVVNLTWQASLWLPLFQFKPGDMRLLPGLDSVLSELVAAYDDWDIASWFSMPNPWLADCIPADTLAKAAPEVLNAARAERFVALA